jgi:hypothetical protein
MRRAWWLVLAASCASSRAADASPWHLTLEAGAEADTNVERVETDPTQTVEPISAFATRTGAEVDHGDRLFGGTLALAGTASARVITNDRLNTSVEDVALVAADARYIHAVGDAPVNVGVALQAADAFAIDADIGDRTFRNLGGDALLVLRASDTRRVTLAVGGRQFEYKPDPDYSYSAPAASARLDMVVWAADDGVRSVELASTLAFEARGFHSTALVDTCPPGTNTMSCAAPSSFLRSDRYNRADITATYVGTSIASLGYQLIVIDSNSYGQALVRHRVTLSATHQLTSRVYLTGIATLQIDQYPDGVLVAADLQSTVFANLEDENRSSLQARVGFRLSDELSIEARGAVWRDLGGGSMSTPTEFHRELVYGGLVYTR